MAIITVLGRNWGTPKSAELIKCHWTAYPISSNDLMICCLYESNLLSNSPLTFSSITTLGLVSLARRMASGNRSRSSHTDAATYQHCHTGRCCCIRHPAGSHPPQNSPIFRLCRLRLPRQLGPQAHALLVGYRLRGTVQRLPATLPLFFKIGCNFSF